MSDKTLSPADVLRRYWGYNSFRPLQEEIIMSTLSGRDTVGLMPTGGGKSLTFQVPGMAVDGITVVITPLISLMKDQVDNLRRRRIKATCLHSGMTSAELRYAWEMIVNARCRFLYVSPERLRSERFRLELKQLPVSRIVVDEAHCVSQWGYDFRPSYLEIIRLRELFPAVPVLALTATATPQVAADIADKLGMRDPAVFRMSFRRDNISYIVRPTEDKINEIFHILSHTRGAAIVYVRSRRKTREIADMLSAAEIDALPYHAGMKPEEKAEFQDQWIKGAVRVIVATNAFGMGIDKPDVRTVIHYDAPSSLEEYYQEAGRAGRDGKPSFAVLLTTRRDQSTLRRRVTDSFPSREEIRRIYELACTFAGVSPGEGFGKWVEFDVDKFCTVFRTERRRTAAALRILAQSGYVEIIDDTHSSSRAKVTTTREDLYHIPRLGETAERTLNWLLRNCPGIFADYISFQESRISSDCKKDTREVYEALLELARGHIIHYIPRKRLPSLFFPTACEEARYVQIPRSVYEERLKSMTARTEAMIDYAFSDGTCRVERMLAYFGDVDSGPCGKCDICRSRRPTADTEEERAEKHVAHILDTLRQYPDGLTAPILCGDKEPAASERERVLRFLVRNGNVRPHPRLDGFFILTDKS